MHIKVINEKQTKKCLVLIGGSGDSSEKFVPLVKLISQELFDYSICTFTFTSSSATESILEIQSRELEQVINQLVNKYSMTTLSLFCTSMGSYATVKLLAKGNFNNKIKKVIMYDPADYYLNSKQDHTWSGSKTYQPNGKVISDELKAIKGKFMIDVIHLTILNYGKSDYINKEYYMRGKDYPEGYPRLNSQMVKSFYNKTPGTNKGKYIEVSDIPHGGIVRDGNIKENVKKVAKNIVDLLT